VSLSFLNIGLAGHWLGDVVHIRSKFWLTLENQHRFCGNIFTVIAFARAGVVIPFQYFLNLSRVDY